MASGFWPNGRISAMGRDASSGTRQGGAGPSSAAHSPINRWKFILRMQPSRSESIVLRIEAFICRSLDEILRGQRTLQASIQHVRIISLYSSSSRCAFALTRQRYQKEKGDEAKLEVDSSSTNRYYSTPQQTCREPLGLTNVDDPILQ